MKRAKTLSILSFIILIPIFAITFISTSWTGSYLMLADNWQQQIVYTPKTATSPKQIYDVDKFLYAFNTQPFEAVICVLSFVLIIGIIIYWIISKFANNSSIAS